MTGSMNNMSNRYVSLENAEVSRKSTSAEILVFKRTWLLDEDRIPLFLTTRTWHCFSLLFGPCVSIVPFLIFLISSWRALVFCHANLIKVALSVRALLEPHNGYLRTDDAWYCE